MSQPCCKAIVKFERFCWILDDTIYNAVVTESSIRTVTNAIRIPDQLPCCKAILDFGHFCWILVDNRIYNAVAT